MRTGMESASIWGFVLLLAATSGLAQAAPPEPQLETDIRSRTAWTGSRIYGTPEPPPPYRTERVYSQLAFAAPALIEKLPGTKRLLVGEVKGNIYSFVDHQDTNKKDVFFDFRKHAPEAWRLYGLAFHPDFAKKRYAYVCYVYRKDHPQGSVVSRFNVTDTDPPKIDPASEKVLIQWPAGGHNGGCLQFGLDGYLYISTGDGSNPSPPDLHGAGQNLSDLRSCILRIDVDRQESGKAYGIPTDNPFQKTPEAKPEIWAYGFRNPWKMCFHPTTGDLWLGDVGWETWEQIHRVQIGGNSGWSVMEAEQPVRPENPRGPTPIVPPVVAHPRSEALSITGGRFYGGRRLADLAGAYVYGDYVTGRIWGLRHEADQLRWHQELAETTLKVIDFGEDHAGEMLILDHDGGIYQLVPNKANHNANFPKKLSETGLFDSTKDFRPVAGVIPYSINTPMWADHATSERWMALPGLSQIGKAKWRSIIRRQFPADGVVAKTLSIEMQRGQASSLRRLETQILHFQEGRWRGYTYAWNDEQTDAVLVPKEGSERTLTIKDALAPGGVRKQVWHYASRTICGTCHNERVNFLPGFSFEQLNRTHDFGGIEANQLGIWEQAGVFAHPLEEDLLKMVDPSDESAELSLRARSYLHANCAHCHRPGGGGNAEFKLAFDVDMEKLGILDKRPAVGTFGISGARVIAAGDPYRSVLYYRMAKLSRGRMPHIGSSVVDQRGTDLLYRWINQMPKQSSRHDGTADEIAERTILSAKGKASVQPEAVERLLSSTAGALRLMKLIGDGKLTKKNRDTVVTAGTASSRPAIRDLFERFLPDDQRVRRLGSVIHPETILNLTGNAKRGEEFFLKATGVQCRNCHQVAGQGGKLGPDLSHVGKKNNRLQLLESILEPSKKIDPKFVGYLLETSSGQIHSGLLVEKSDVQVVLRDAKNELIKVPVGEVELLVPQSKSFMPELLLRDMTADEVADLLAFLVSLK